MSKLWRCLEDVRGLVAVPAVWGARLDGEFGAVRSSYLASRKERARSVPCPRGCGCAHEVVKHDDGKLIGVCRCESWNCEDIELSDADLVLLELNVSKLGREIVQAFGCDAKPAKLSVADVLQVGSFERTAVPLLLAIPHDVSGLCAVATSLAATLNGPFVLFVPTARFVTAESSAICREAKIVALDGNLSFSSDGKLCANSTAEKLFGDVGMSALGAPIVRHTLEGIHREISAVREERTEMREENTRLKQMHAEGFFKFTQRVDAKTFKVLCTVLAQGDVAKASRELKMKDSTLRELIKGWSGRGKAYALCADLVRWRKKVGRKEVVPLNDAVLLERTDTNDHADLLSDVLDELLQMNDLNWEDKVSQLVEVLRPCTQ